MSRDSDARIKLDRLGEALAKDLDALSDDELMEEIAATDQERQKTVSHMRSLIEEAIALRENASDLRSDKFRCNLVGKEDGAASGPSPRFRLGDAKTSYA